MAENPFRDPQDGGEYERGSSKFYQGIKYESDIAPFGGGAQYHPPSNKAPSSKVSGLSSTAVSYNDIANQYNIDVEVGDLPPPSQSGASSVFEALDNLGSTPVFDGTDDRGGSFRIPATRYPSDEGGRASVATPYKQRVVLQNNNSFAEVDSRDVSDDSSSSSYDDIMSSDETEEEAEGSHVVNLSHLKMDPAPMTPERENSILRDAKDENIIWENQQQTNTSDSMGVAMPIFQADNFEVAEEPKFEMDKLDEEEGVQAVGQSRTRLILCRIYIFGWVIVTAMVASAVGILINNRIVEGKSRIVNTQSPTLPPILPELSPSLSPSFINSPSAITPKPTTSLPTPTSQPTKSPTRDTVPVYPTFAPTGQPVKLPPTAAPTPTAPTPTAPTSPVTSSPTSREDGIISIISSISRYADMVNPSTPQYAASQWIINTDPLALQPSSPTLIQRYVLTTFYFATSGDRWQECGRTDATCTEKWLSGTSECSWFGMGCNANSGMVNALQITENGLSGELPPEISQLTSLISLVMSRNVLTGTIPTDIIMLASLRTLLLNNNKLKGTIPPNLDTLNLRTLSLGINALSGTLPSTMFSSSLRNLDLEGNFLDGTIPLELFDSRRLIRVDLSTNSFDGTISPRWGSLEDLEILTLNTNYLSGSLPSDLFDAKSLQIFSIGMNALTGTIPTKLFDSTQLIFIGLGVNSFSGQLPSLFGKLTNLKQLVLWQNEFTGTIPTELGAIANLEMLQLPYNYLTGGMPKEVCAMTPEPLKTLIVDCSVTCDCCSSCLEGYD